MLPKSPLTAPVLSLALTDRALPTQTPTDYIPRSVKPIRSQFWPWTLLRDTGSLTVETKSQCALRRAGLLYAQLYNTSKEIFAVGKVYPFGNLALDTLALPAALVRILQHTGGAHAYSRATLLRGYLHTKARCHAALKGAQGRSYSAREEYRVTAELLEALDNEMITQEADEHRIQPRTSRSFYCHRTDDALTWLRWNLNRLCLAIELIYSLRPVRYLHWEHSRVAMVMMRALYYGFGG
ncbi:hypothetical protein N7523_006537 [Penicillium sp. IBT 18751x]|nr:hypothetical protein N7523_006537 [Penicillium sp. IBT 18751x]